MGNVSQHYMEQIEENHEFTCIVNPHHGNEPEPDFEVEIIDQTERISKSAKGLFYHRDLVTQLNILSDLRHQVNHAKFLVSKHYGRISEELENREEDRKEAQRDYAEMQDVYSEVRTDLIYSFRDTRKGVDGGFAIPPPPS